MKPQPDPCYRHRFPAEVISHAVWLYHVFSLSLRDVELLLAERGVVVSYESVRRWCTKFAASFADRMRRRRPQPGDKWHMDEVFIRIQGVQHYLWRAVDQNGVALDILVQARRDANAAKRFFQRLLKGLQYVPRVIVTDKLRSYGVARRHLLPSVEHRQSRYLNNRAENSHRPSRRREQQIAALQIVSAGPALPVSARVHLRTLPSSTSSNGGRPLPGIACHGIQGLAAGDVWQSGGIITPWVLVLGSNATVSG